MESQQSSKTRPISTWFDKMGASLDWKLVPPDIVNPFRPPVSDDQLLEWLHSPNALRKASSVKVLCDGYEILYIKNLLNPILCTDHPCITTMQYTQILDYLVRSKIELQIEAELEHAREIIRAEVALRDAQASEQSRKRTAKIIEKKKKANAAPAPGGSNYRVIRG